MDKVRSGLWQQAIRKDKAEQLMLRRGSWMIRSLPLPIRLEQHLKQRSDPGRTILSDKELICGCLWSSAEDD